MVFPQGAMRPQSRSVNVSGAHVRLRGTAEAGRSLNRTPDQCQPSTLALVLQANSEESVGDTEYVGLTRVGALALGVQLPATVPTGAVAVQASAGGVRTQAGALLFVSKPQCCSFNRSTVGPSALSAASTSHSARIVAVTAG
jgi:hypothetical protein